MCFFHIIVFWCLFFCLILNWWNERCFWSVDKYLSKQAMLCFYFQLAISIGIIYYLNWLLRYVIVDALFSREIRGKTILVIGSSSGNSLTKCATDYLIWFQDLAMILWWNVFERVLSSLPAVNQHRYELSFNCHLIAKSESEFWY